MKAKTVLSRHTSLCIWNPKNTSRLCWFMMKIINICVSCDFFPFYSLISQFVYIYKYLQVYSNWPFHHIYNLYKCELIDLFIIFITFTSVNWSSHKEFFPLVYFLVDPQTNLNYNPPPLSYTLYSWISKCFITRSGFRIEDYNQYNNKKSLKVPKG